MANLPKIFPLGDNAITIDFGNEISLELNERAVSLAGDLNTYPFPGLIEAVPAYSSVTVFYDLPQIGRDVRVNVFQEVQEIVNVRLSRMGPVNATETRLIEIPVDFGDQAALDVDFLREHAGCTREECIDIFLSRTYRVYMLGFLPGFAYMGEVDDRIAVPRRATPRTKVPKGSVGIAGRQTGIYPLESPGGWQIIGRTDTELFTPDDSLSLLRPGDRVRFVPA